MEADEGFLGNVFGGGVVAKVVGGETDGGFVVGVEKFPVIFFFG